MIFLAVLPLLLVPAVWLLRDREMLAMLAVFFVSSLIALAVAVAPMGWRALPALGFRPAGFWPIVLGAVGALIVSVAVSQLGEPEGVKQALDVARTPSLFVASLVVMALLAPLVEEVVFRGLLYGWVAGRWGTDDRLVRELDPLRRRPCRAGPRPPRPAARPVVRLAAAAHRFAVAVAGGARRQ